MNRAFSIRRSGNPKQFKYCIACMENNDEQEANQEHILNKCVFFQTETN